MERMGSWPHRWKSPDGRRMLISDPERGIGISIEHYENLTTYDSYCFLVLMLRPSTKQPGMVQNISMLGLN